MGFCAVYVIQEVFFNHIFLSPGVKVAQKERIPSHCLAIKKNESCNPQYVLEMEYTVGNIHHPSHRLLLGTDLLFLGNSVSLAGFWCDAIISIAAAGLDQVSVL